MGREGKQKKRRGEGKVSGEEKRQENKVKICRTDTRREEKGRRGWKYSKEV